MQTGWRATCGCTARRAGEEIMALDDKSYVVPEGAMVISDDAGVQSIAGIMGGAATGVSEDTVNVLVESAFWDHVQIALAGRCAQDPFGRAVPLRAGRGPGVHPRRAGPRGQDDRRPRGR